MKIVEAEALHSMLCFLVYSNMIYLFIYLEFNLLEFKCMN